MLNLDELERKLDEALGKETPESLKNWIEEKRKTEAPKPKIKEDWTEKELFAKQLWDRLLDWIADDCGYYDEQMILHKIENGMYDITHTEPMMHLQKNEDDDKAEE